MSDVLDEADVEAVALAIERSSHDTEVSMREAWEYENVRHNRMIEARAAIRALEQRGYRKPMQTNGS